MIQVALFDFDGTLIDSESVHLACWNRVLAPLGAEIDAAFYGSACAGLRSEEIAERILRHTPSLSHSSKELAAAKNRCYQDWTAAHDLALMPGAASFLATLAASGIRLGLVTGAADGTVRPTLGAHGLLDAFAVRVTRDQVLRGKPAPESYHLALQRLAVPGSAAVAFEDTVVGVQSAATAGVLTVAVPNVYTLTHDFSAADYVVRDLAEAQALITPLLA